MQTAYLPQVSSAFAAPAGAGDPPREPVSQLHIAPRREGR